MQNMKLLNRKMINLEHESAAGGAKLHCLTVPKALFFCTNLLPLKLSAGLPAGTSSSKNGTVVVEITTL